MGTVAFPDLGQHCSEQSCRLVDFLPFKCDACNLSFCLDHRTYAAHECKSATNRVGGQVLVCPLCARGVPLVEGEDANITWARHSRTSCDPSSYNAVKKKPRCSAAGCKEALTAVNKVTCKDCNKDLCLRHRYQAEHACEGKKVNKVGTASQQTMLQRLSLQASSAMQSASTMVGQVATAASTATASGSSSMSKYFSSSGTTSRVAAGSSAQASAAAAAASARRKAEPKPDDPLNSVRGSAARRAQGQDKERVINRAQVGGGGGGGGSAARQPGSNNPEPAPPSVPPTRGVQVGGGVAPAGVEGGASNSPAAARAGGEERCPQCGEGFGDVMQLICHVEAQHEGRSPGNSGTTAAADNRCLVC